MTASQPKPLSWRQAGVLAVIAVGCFHAAYTPAKSGLHSIAIIGYVICLVQLARLRTTRQSFYGALATGFACFAPQLEFFWRIFGLFAVALWLVLALWIALFVALAHLALIKLGPKRAAILMPFLWTGLEYFRSELYYLKFSWLNLGFALTETSFALFHSLGVYGVGFCGAVVAALFLVLRLRDMLICSATGLIFCVVLAPLIHYRGFNGPHIAGVQLEFLNASLIQQALDGVLAEHAKRSAGKSGTGLSGNTNLDLIVLSEYTLDGEPTDALKDWCRTSQKFLIVGGKDSSPGTNYYNTAFVISTNGEVVFKQVKSMPIQFFKDGLPAPEQKLWDSPWGKIGICICYDLCYTRVTDELIRQGAQMLIVPTMDVADWGRHQHELHARVAPVRAAEYGIPIFRVASSGISQGVNRFGKVQTSAPFPGEGEIIFFGARIGAKGSLPIDRWLAPLSVGVTALYVLWLTLTVFQRKPAVKSQPAAA